MTKSKVVTLTVNIDVWLRTEEDVPKSVEQIMSRLNYKELEEFGGCHLLQYSTEVVDDETHNCHDMYDHVRNVNEPNLDCMNDIKPCARRAQSADNTCMHRS